MIFVGNHHHQWLVGCRVATCVVDRIHESHCNSRLIRWWVWFECFAAFKSQLSGQTRTIHQPEKKTPRNEGHSLPEAKFGVMSCDIVISHPEFSSTLPWIAKFFLFFSSFIPCHNQVGSGPHCQLFEPMVCSWIDGVSSWDVLDPGYLR